jgi:hypothetical protein
MSFKLLILLSSALSIAQGKTCVPDLLLDDFSNVHEAIADENTLTNVNLQGGGYGGYNLNPLQFTQAINGVPNSGKVAVTAKTNPPNWFFFKVESKACFDLSLYTALKMTVKFPAIAGSGGKFVLTQKPADCIKILDSKAFSQ